jgi:predicted HD phosphohydrolase
VPAKRYLCATDAEYQSQLSPASVQSLALQGGPFTPAEVAEFERNPHFRAAVALRRWDDLAKIPDLAVPPLDAYRPQLARVLHDA